MGDLVDIGHQPVQVKVNDEPLICFKLKQNSDNALVNGYQQKRCKGCTKKAHVERPDSLSGKDLSYNEGTNLVDQRLGRYKSKRQKTQMIDLSNNEGNENRFAGKPVLDDTFTNNH